MPFKLTSKTLKARFFAFNFIIYKAMETIIKGLVIKKRDYQDDDQIVQVWTAVEIVTLVAVGTRKMASKNRFALEVGNVVQCEIFKAKLPGKISKLKKAVIVFQPPVHLSYVSRIVLNITSKLSQNPQCFSPLVFPCVSEAFPFLGPRYSTLVQTYVLFYFLDALGVFPQKTGCTECARTDRITYFSLHQGGFSCVFHSRESRSLEELRAFWNLFRGFGFYKGTSARVNKVVYQEVEKQIQEQMF